MWLFRELIFVIFIESRAVDVYADENPIIIEPIDTATAANT